MSVILFSPSEVFEFGSQFSKFETATGSVFAAEREKSIVAAARFRLSNRDEVDEITRYISERLEIIRGGRGNRITIDPANLLREQ